MNIDIVIRKCVQNAENPLLWVEHFQQANDMLMNTSDDSSWLDVKDHGSVAEHDRVFLLVY